VKVAPFLFGQMVNEVSIFVWIMKKHSQSQTQSTNSLRTEMTTKLVDDYVNFIMDSMSQQIKEETLYEYLVNDYKDLSEKELTQQILENYGDEWFEWVKENN
jgi:hypothetical protein